jgi:hypothetical protein
MKARTLWKWWLDAALALSVVVSAAGVAAGASAADVDAAPAAEVQQDEAALHMAAMTRYLASLPGFQVRLLGSYDAVQESGQKIEFHELRDIALARPGRLRVRHVRSDGVESLIVFDGKTISVLNGEANVYAQAPQPGALDDAIVYFVRDLGMRLPLARLLTSRAPEELERRVQSLVYVERTTVLPVPVHHIAGRAGNVDVQLWIADGDQPLPLRIVLTYVDEPGQPQFRAQFLDWKTEPPGGTDTFRFTPPPGARQIAFAVQVPAVTAGGAKRTDKGARP